MSAPAGNKFWLARSSHGRKPKFSSPDDLWGACCEYFQWVEDNPLWENKATQYQGAPIDVPIAKMRAMTIGGLCIFLDIDHTTWREFRQREDLSTIVAKVESIIYEQKFTGAAADLLNPNIIARELGLSEKKELTGAGGGAINIGWVLEGVKPNADQSPST